MSRFFGRRATIVVQPKNQGPETNVVGVRISSPLRIQFQVTKQPYTPPNTCDISITNLSEATRKQMQRKGADIELRAGYADDARPDITHLPLLFRGDARTIDHVRKGAEWITRIQCGDGETAYRYGMATVARSPGVPVTDVLKDFAQQLTPSGIDISAFLGQLAGIGGQVKKKQFVTGFAAQGNALQEMQKILAPEGFAVSVQDGQLQVLAQDGVSGRPIVRIAPDSGMLDSPEHGSPDKNGLPSILKVSSLLLPRVLPGDQVMVDAAATKGVFRAEKVTHTGDTHGGDWKTEIEARPRPGA